MFKPEDVQKLDRDTLEGYLVVTAQLHLPEKWNEHKKQAVLSFIRKYLRNVTRFELEYMNTNSAHALFILEGLIDEAGKGYDRLMEKRRKSIEK